MAMQLPQNIMNTMKGAGAPPSPEMPADPNNPGAAAVDPNQMTPEQMKADIESKLSDVEGKNAQLNAQNISETNSSDQMRAQIMQDLFSIMEKNGVDLKDPKSIRGFLENLANSDPDLYEIFEMAFNNLVGNEENTPPTTPETLPGNAPDMNSGAMPGLMGRFNNLAGDTMMGADNASPVAPPPMSPAGL